MGKWTSFLPSSRPGVRLSGTGHREDVRLQETGEEEDQEEERRVNGAQREADPGESQQQIRCKMELRTVSAILRRMSQTSLARHVAPYPLPSSRSVWRTPMRRRTPCASC